MFHGRKGLQVTGRWTLLAVMAVLLSGLGLSVAPGAGADKITDINGCGQGTDAPLHSDKITIIGGDDCCNSTSSVVRSDKITIVDGGDTSSCGDNNGDNDGSGGGDDDNDGDSDDVGSTTGLTGPTGPTGPAGLNGNTPTITSGATTTAASGGIQLVKGASSKGKAKACTSRRLFVIHIRHPKGQYLVSANANINGKRVATTRGRRISSTIRLVGLPKGTVKVHIRAVTNTGKVLHGARTYHTCMAGLHGSVPKL